jgi:hypothetical protein
MQWQVPIIVHDAHDMSEQALAAAAQTFRLRLLELTAKS